MDSSGINPGEGKRRQGSLTHIILFSSHNNPLGWVLLLSFYILGDVLTEGTYLEHSLVSFLNHCATYNM